MQTTAFGPRPAANNGSFTYQRRLERRQARHKVRRVCSDVRYSTLLDDLEDFDDHVEIQHEWKERQPYLKWLPAYLDSHVDRPWAVIYRDLCRRCPKGTYLRTRLDQELSWQVCADADRYKYWDLYLDPEGILRRKPDRPRYRPSPPDGREELTAWLDGRRVIQHGTAYFWAVDGHVYYPHRDFSTWVPPYFRCKKHVGTFCERHYRQSTPMTPTEVAYFTRFSSHLDFIVHST